KLPAVHFRTAVLIVLMLIQLPTHNVNEEWYVQSVGRFDDGLEVRRADFLLYSRQNWDEHGRPLLNPISETSPGAGELLRRKTFAEYLLKGGRQRETRQALKLVVRQHDDAAEQSAVDGLFHVAIVIVERPRTDHVVFHVDVIGPGLA